MLCAAAPCSLRVSFLRRANARVAALGRLAGVAMLTWLCGCGTAEPTPPMPDLAEPQAAVGCSPENCTGCCFAGICQTGTSITGCGSGGQSCRVCNPAAYEICLPQQTCDLDPNGLWRFLLTEARIRQTNGSKNWDVAALSKPDPYFKMGMFTSPTQDDTLSPTWTDQGKNYRASDLTSLGVTLELWDKDMTSADDVIAPARLFRFQTADLAAGQVTVTGWGQTDSVTLRFVKLPP